MKSTGILLLMFMSLLTCTSSADLRDEAEKQASSGDFPGAIQTLLKAIEKDETDFDAWMTLGWHMFQQANFLQPGAERNAWLMDARMRFAFAAKLRPGEWQPQRNLAMVSKELRDVEACDIHWRKAKELGARDKWFEGCGQ
jgi:Flp pilus assembly protein TadD